MKLKSAIMEKISNFINKDKFGKSMEYFNNYEKHSSLEGGFKEIFFQSSGNKYKLSLEIF